MEYQMTKKSKNILTANKWFQARVSWVLLTLLIVLNVENNNNNDKSQITSHSKDSSSSKTRRVKNNAVGAEVKFLLDCTDLSKQIL